ncbi:periplasmic heavy metal sensor [Sulfitobacter sp. M57]|uniref:periplasmic heavy metal sensor n=1 Tax=unclassified Sulfitobacter TaxID=196795 RepID=UPI0023E128EA|nr:MULTISPECIES: periplasmic heavy metal sensor [unclassified Sulfitobacter]MDF3413135.1 periplasmic heavy metal sensor [Sulfitobacter sp. KE5]MDF3421582.1 periplasmic heavy metal sensor [Sulfitobacter sp. KE43]MDF3431684.1 periplasmic heavy metal sensor [Sulfitobacter sp. KE42]MDF3457325.1 periplasmic heavy metal sensor [Sulfitobacter sp. S74]MDF3461227.1 periplasmic heavy metal sensor [Sulfitobacter sp. Ks18]
MTQTPLPAGRRGRALKWAFGISLALNLVFVGIFAGAALRHTGGKRGWDRIGEPVRSSGVPFLRALPKEDRRALRQVLKEGAHDLPSRAARREMQQEMIAVLRADPFEAAEMSRLFAAQTEAAKHVSGKMQSAWLDRVGAMSAQERAKVADRLEEMLKRRRHKPPKHP